MNQTNPNDSHSNFVANIQYLTIDSREDILFDIFNYLKIDISQELKEQWEGGSKLPFPFYCEVECTIVAQGIPITCPVIIQSGQMETQLYNLPCISNLHKISRKQHRFLFEPKKDPHTNQLLNFNVKLPISYSELPLDSTLRLTFYACPFQTRKSLIGIAEHKIFNESKLRKGPRILPFLHDRQVNEQSTTKTMVKKKLRAYYHKISFNKIPAYSPYSNHIKIIYENLHPDDSCEFVNSLFSTLEHPQLSESSKYIMINIPALETSFHPKKTQSFDTFYGDYSTGILYFSKKLTSSLIQKQFAEIRNIKPLSEIPPQYKLLIVDSLRHHLDSCFEDPSLYFVFFQSLQWCGVSEIIEITSKLKTIPTVDIGSALEFFTDRYNFQPVREYAIRCIKEHFNDQRDEVLLYLPQLVQALKREHTKELKCLLIDECRHDVDFASRFYWTACSDPSGTMKLIIKELFESIDSSVSVEIKKSISLMKEIEGIISPPADEQGKKRSKSEKEQYITNIIQNNARLQRFKEPILSPIDPSLVILGILPKDVRIFTSKTEPVRLSLIVKDAKAHNAPERIQKYMFKVGDDMRQDQLVMQLFHIMNRLFILKDNDLNILTYKILAISPTYGCMEFVDNTAAIFDIDSIDRKKNDISNFQCFKELRLTETEKANFLKSTIFHYLIQDNPTADTLKKRLDTYTKSLAGYTIMTYILTIGDRHEHNILITQDGHFLHIDFGFVFGDDAKPLTQPVRIRENFLLPIDAKMNNALISVVTYAWPAFREVRKHSRLLLALIELMISADIECFRAKAIDKLRLLEQGLMLDLNDDAALPELLNVFLDSIKSSITTFYDYIHEVATKINKKK